MHAKDRDGIWSGVGVEIDVSGFERCTNSEAAQHAAFPLSTATPTLIEFKSIRLAYFALDCTSLKGFANVHLRSVSLLS